jgi:hypothetical protein
MGTTPNYDIPYPECDRPLREDASNIADFRDLAEAVDDALDVVYAQAAQEVFNPAVCRMATGAAVAAVGQNLTPFYNITSVTNDLNMYDVVNGVIRIIEPGRYWVGTYTSLTALGMASPRARFLLNGASVSNFQTPGIVIDSNTATCQASAVISVTQASAAFSSGVRHSASAALAYTYTSRIWCLQLEAY